MPSSIALDFADLGSSGSVDIPASYEGFHWAGYQLDEAFGGSARVTLPEGAISGVGFQMTAENGGSFDLTSLSITPQNQSLSLDITIKARANTAQGLVEVASLVIRTGGGGSTGVFNMLLKNIHQLEIYSNAMDAFKTSDITVTV